MPPAYLQVFKQGLAKSIHHARVLIRQKHIRCVAVWAAAGGGAGPTTAADRGSILSAGGGPAKLQNAATRAGERAPAADRKGEGSEEACGEEGAGHGDHVPGGARRRMHAPGPNPPPQLLTGLCACASVVMICSVGKQVVDVPSFLVRVDSQKHIDFALTSPFGGGRPGRVKRRSQK